MSVKPLDTKPMNMDLKISTILLCGVPGVGKTTLIQKICQKIQSNNKVNCRGFFTEEVRSPDSGQRIGFDVVTLKGLRGVLARESLGIQNVNCPTVGKYRVFIREFENVALPPLATCPRSSGELLVIDEIGKMELKSRKFATTVKSLLNQMPLLATVPDKTDKLPFVQEILFSPNSKVYHITMNNRDHLADEVIQDLKAILT